LRRLSPDEQALWDRVAATIRPLSRDPVAELPAKPIAAVPVTAKPKGRVPPPRPLAPPVAAARPLDRHGLDSHWERRIKAGTIEPDRVLDLHGHNLDRAWAAIDQALDDAIRRGERVLLFITGHARPGEPPVQRGKIRAAVNDWLSVSRHKGHILAVRGAHRRHGGGGSLYIILSR
jgi:DNA-nicking Smr family endonuclease